MALWLEIDQRSGVPIYVQIVDSVRRALEVGSLRPGERLPTVRDLSAEHRIAPNTVVKAYAELQHLNLVESRAGVGTVIAANVAGAVQERQLAALFTRLRQLVRDAAALGVSPEDLRQRLEQELAATDPPTPDPAPFHPAAQEPV